MSISSMMSLRFLLVFLFSLSFSPLCLGSEITSLGEVTEQLSVRRGFFVRGDVGTYLAFGGKSTNVVVLTDSSQILSQSISQPRLMAGVLSGYDFRLASRLGLTLGVRLIAAFNGGASRISDAEIATVSAADLQTRVSDFAMYAVSPEVSLGWLLTSRLAWNYTVGAGVAFIDPDPFQYAANVGATELATAMLFSGATGLEYFTRLQGFSIGIEARFLAVQANSFIPGMSISVPVKYNF